MKDHVRPLLERPHDDGKKRWDYFVEFFDTYVLLAESEDDDGMARVTRGEDDPNPLRHMIRTLSKNSARLKVGWLAGEEGEKRDKR